MPAKMTLRNPVNSKALDASNAWISSGILKGLVNGARLAGYMQSIMERVASDTGFAFGKSSVSA